MPVTDIVTDLTPEMKRLLFVRWLVANGRLGADDTAPAPPREAKPLAVVAPAAPASTDGC